MSEDKREKTAAGRPARLRGRRTEELGRVYLAIGLDGAETEKPDSAEGRAFEEEVLRQACPAGVIVPLRRERDGVREYVYETTGRETLEDRLKREPPEAVRLRRWLAQIDRILQEARERLLVPGSFYLCAERIYLGEDDLPELICLPGRRGDPAAELESLAETLSEAAAGQDPETERLCVRFRDAAGGKRSPHEILQSVLAVQAGETGTGAKAAACGRTGIPGGPFGNRDIPSGPICTERVYTEGSEEWNPSGALVLSGAAAVETLTDRSTRDARSMQGARSAWDARDGRSTRSRWSGADERAGEKQSLRERAEKVKEKLAERLRPGEKTRRILMTAVAAAATLAAAAFLIAYYLG